MSLTNTLVIPALKADISLSIYPDDVTKSAPRFLLTLGENYFLLSSKSRALVLALLRSSQNIEQLEREYANESGHHLSAEKLLALAEKTLPKELFAGSATPARSLPFIVSATILPQRIAAAICTQLRYFFIPKLALLLVGVFLILHALVMPSAMSVVHSTWSNLEVLGLISLVLLSGFIHELGHIAACRYFGCEHGGVGFGLYFIFPAWYADVSRAWTLSRRQRAVVDLGGVYLQSIFLIMVDIHALTYGGDFSYKLIWLITFTMLFTLNPVFKFDGYWLLSDLSGLHNLHQQVRESSARVLATVFRFKNTAVTSIGRQQQIILFAYTMLSTSYFLYFAWFLLNEIRLITIHFPAKLSVDIQKIFLTKSYSWELTLSFWYVICDLVWPALILTASIFFFKKLWASLQEIFKNIKKAYVNTPLESLGTDAS